MTPLLARIILLSPERIRATLERAAAAGAIDTPPNDWQLALGVLRLWHRTILRGETVGTSPDGVVLAGWRARLLQHKAFRLPALLAEGAVVPLDFTGLRSGPERIIRHLLGAHHDQNQFVYDLEVLTLHPGALERLRAAAAAVLAEDTPRTRWLRDLTVFEGYHERLLAAVDESLARGPAMSVAEASDPDISLRAYLRWCARQPATPAATWRALRDGRFAFDSGLPAPGPAVRASLGVDELLRMSRGELAEVVQGGHDLAAEDVADFEYRGISLGLPAWVDRLAWKKFIKVFHRDAASGRVRGWNVRAVQDDLDRPWRAQEQGGRPRSFGHFAVRAASAATIGPAPAPACGLLLDYGAGGNRRLDPISRLRDPLVAVHAGSSELLLGWSYLDLGVGPVGTPSYFVLTRGGRRTHVAEPPVRRA